jgi:hypothetical protein
MRLQAQRIKGNLKCARKKTQIKKEEEEEQEKVLAGGLLSNAKCYKTMEKPSSKH